MKGASSMDKEKLKKAFLYLAAMHAVEAPIAYAAAKKRGKNPKLYFVLTSVFGVFVLVPLLRLPEEEQ